jgi:predicted hydrolase (HD superfamily)
MGKIPSLEEAQKLLEEYNKDPFHLRHAQIVSGVMGYFAREYDPENEEFWKVAGLLHDLDFEQFPEQHCVKEQELMRERGIDEKLIHAVASHGYGLTVNVKPEQFMEKILFATDELTGLIGAVALMHPSKSVSDMQLKSVKKKFKTPAFAAGCSREVIQKGADMLGWSLDDLMSRTIDAMKSLVGTMEI